MNDVVRWRFDWSFTEEYDMPHNGPVPTPREGQVGGPGAPVMPAFPNGLPTGGSANAMDADHQSALNNYNSGNFSGAPVQ